MVSRFAEEKVRNLLDEFPVVGVLGPRQVGKTTLAALISAAIDPQPIYLDLESPVDQVKLTEPEQYFALHEDRLVVLDEIQRVPEIFTVLRSVVDRRRRQGRRNGQFLVLGSASLDLLQQTSETLAGRIAYVELTGLLVPEVMQAGQAGIDRLWLRGGFPDAFLADDDRASLRWRLNFISTYLEREIPQLGPRIPAVLLRRLWTMLAHGQGSQLNMATLASGLGVAAPTVKRYIELLEDLLLIRTLRPWSGNIGKRLVKSPKVYIRDSGLAHALLHLTSFDDLLGHPVVGTSWEGFVIENIASFLPEGITPWYYRTSAGAEIDLVIEKNAGTRIALEIKRSLTPSVSKGFHLGCRDIRASQCFVVYPGTESFPIGNEVSAISVAGIMELIRSM